MGVHAVLSPSSAGRWSTCTASVAAAALNTEPDEGSDAARLGTCGHQMLEDALRDAGVDLQAYLGREYVFWSHPESDSEGSDWIEDITDERGEPRDLGLEFIHTVTVDQDLIDAVLSAYDYVVEQAELIGGQINAEMRVPICHITDEEDAHGTSDVIITSDSLLVVVADLKLGRIKVDAYDVLEPAGEDIVTGKHTPEVLRPNLQLTMYALGVVRALAPRKFTDVRLTIVQPFLNHVSDWHGTVAELEEVGRWLSARAKETKTNPVFRPSEKACHFCRAKPCAAYTELVATTALEGFDEEPFNPRVKEPKPLDLGTAYALLPLVKRWVDAVGERVRVALENGEPVVGPDGVPYKLVEGRKGDRQWLEPDTIAATLEVCDVPASLIYKRKVLSPADAEKLAKVRRAKKGEQPVPPVIAPALWSALQEDIIQSDGAPTIVPQTDPRPNIQSKLDGFEDVPDADNSDLF